MTGPAFSTAVLHPDAPVPKGLIDPQGRAADRRFAVYRNNVTVGLTRALEDGFPTVRSLVGEDFFAATAREYLRAHPPRSPILALYGADFANFLQAFAPAAKLGYLPDIARLDYAMRQSYHAADTTPADMAAIRPDALPNARLVLAPSLRVLRSDWPIHAIWAANTRGGPKPAMCAQEVLIARTGFDPEPHLLPPGGAAVLAAIADRMTLADALDCAPDCDPTALLTLLIGTGAIIRIDP